MDKLFVTLFVWQLTVADKLRSRREAGQGALEYIGMVAVAAVVVIAVVAVFREVKFGDWINGIISDVQGKTDPVPG